MKKVTLTVQLTFEVPDTTNSRGEFCTENLQSELRDPGGPIVRDARLIEMKTVTWKVDRDN